MPSVVSFFKETTVLVFPGIFTFSFFSSWFFLTDCSRFCQYDTCFSQKREAIWQGMFKNGQKTNGIKKPSFYLVGMFKRATGAFLSVLEAYHGMTGTTISVRRTKHTRTEPGASTIPRRRISYRSKIAYAQLATDRNASNNPSRGELRLVGAYRLRVHRSATRRIAECWRNRI